MKSCAAWPTASSGEGSPIVVRIGRDSQGPGSTNGGQTPSTRPPSTMTSADCSLASNRPQMNTRGCSAPAPPRNARRVRTTAPSSTASSRPGRTPRGWSPSTGSAACTADRAVASASPSSPAHSRDGPGRSSVAASRSAAAIRPASMSAGAASTAAVARSAGSRQVSIRASNAAAAGGSRRSSATSGVPGPGVPGRVRLRLTRPRARPILAPIRAHPVHALAQPGQPGAGARAAQRGQLQRTRAGPAGGRRQAGAGQRMLQHRQQRHRREVLGQRHRQQAQKHRWRRGGGFSPALSSAITP